MRLTRYGPDAFLVDMTPGPIRYRQSWLARVAEWVRRWLR
jgi:hypothetical protein